MATIKSDTSKLYLLNSKGKLFALKNGNQLDQLVSAIEIKRVAFASESRDVLYGIGSDLKAVVWVTEPEVPIRQVVELYQNERWTPMRGFSDSLLPTDRWHWSDETGKMHRPRDLVSVPSQEWAWEGANWEIDENFEGTLLGPDGWTYAVDFPAAYTAEKKWNSMVRRRRWIRTCRYRSTSRWAPLYAMDTSQSELAFLDISAGGCDLSYPDGLMRLSVWAVSVNGQVFVRTQCERATAYHGVGWLRVDLPEGVEVVQVSSGPADGVWAFTTTGWALVRTGLSRDSQFGTGWTAIEPPTDISLAQVAVGPSSVWAIGNNGSIWFRQGVRRQPPAGTAWISISDFKASCLTITRNGEVFAVNSLDQQLYWRTRVTVEDPHGRAWKRFAMKEPSSDPWIWISGTAGFLDTKSPTWEATEEWKDDLIGQLAERFSKEMKGFVSLNRAISRSGWKNSTVLKVWSGKLADWEECTVTVGCDVDDDFMAQLTVEGATIQIALFMMEVTAVQLHEDPQGIQEIWIYTEFFARATTPLRISGSRYELEQWSVFLTECYWSQLQLKDLAKIDRLWLLAPSTGCPSVSYDTPQKMLAGTKWLTLSGHFEVVESASGITWALGHDNSVWIWVGCYEGKTGTERRIQTDTHTVEVYENQRWNPLAGFSSTLLPTDRYCWSDKTGVPNVTKDSFQLPSSSWRWETDWLVDYGRSDEDGWRYSFDFPGYYHAQKCATDYVRRRRWYRVMKVESTGPWIPGPSTKLKSLSICPGVPAGEIVPVWGVTVDGSVVVRDRVTTSSPQGDTWIAVKNPSPFCEISVGPFCVWATAADGTAYVRNGTKTKMDGLYWFQVEKPNSTACLIHVTVGGGVVWAVDQDHKLFFRKNFSAAFPEGTEWVEVADGIDVVSANLRDELYAITAAPPPPGLPMLARRTGVGYDDKMGSGWEYGLFAKHVSARGLVI